MNPKSAGKDQKKSMKRLKKLTEALIRAVLRSENEVPMCVAVAVTVTVSVPVTVLVTVTLAVSVDVNANGTRTVPVTGSCLNILTRLQSRPVPVLLSEERSEDTVPLHLHLSSGRSTLSLPLFPRGSCSADHSHCSVSVPSLLLSSARKSGRTRHPQRYSLSISLFFSLCGCAHSSAAELPTDQAQRGFVYAAKVLQHLVNGHEFGEKEACIRLSLSVCACI